jgi:hypothetical protein
MARPKNLETLAVSYLNGSCITNLEVERRTATYIETVQVKRRNDGKVKVVSKSKIDIKQHTDNVYSERAVETDTRNGLPYQGMYAQHEFYGSPEAYRKLLAMEA